MSFDIASLIERSGGEVVGKVRFQKIIYLLDQLGLASNFAFEYHHYGPYSEELADTIQEQVIFGNIEVKIRNRKSDGMPYAVFTSKKIGAGDSIEGRISAKTLDDALGEFKTASATVLEIAATIHWLAFVEKVPDWKTELFARKGSKAGEGRDKEALVLLEKLGLAPA